MQMLGVESQALRFPEQAEVPEGQTHLELRTLLYLFLKRAFAEVAAVGSEQFVYWDPADPGACLAPDAFVCFGARSERFDSWQVWERGVPQVAVEIISKSDALAWESKLERYGRLGVRELVWFNPDLSEQPLRVWDFLGDGLLERKLLEPWARSLHLGAYWIPIEVPGEGLTLRLSHDPRGEDLFLTPEEAQARRADLAERELQQLKALLAQKE